MTQTTQTTQKQIDEKRKSQFQLVSVVSHELKSPLAAVSNYLQLMDKQFLGADIAAYHEYISRSLIRINDMEKLIHDLLDLAQIESDDNPRQLQPVSLDQMIQAVITRYDDELRARNLQLTTQIEPIILEADPTELNIIIQNLLTNAIQYNRDGGVVSVCLKEHAGQCVFSVTDTGIGISAQDQAVLFDEFARIRNQHTLHISGTGIGLFAVKKLVKRYHGDIQVTSKEGDGTTFTITLPLKNPTLGAKL